MKINNPTIVKAMVAILLLEYLLRTKTITIKRIKKMRAGKKIENVELNWKTLSLCKICTFSTILNESVEDMQYFVRTKPFWNIFRANDHLML